MAHIYYSLGASSAHGRASEKGCAVKHPSQPAAVPVAVVTTGCCYHWFRLQLLPLFATAVAGLRMEGSDDIG